MGYQTERRRLAKKMRGYDEMRRERLERTTPEWKKGNPLSKKQRKEANRKKKKDEK